MERISSDVLPELGLTDYASIDVSPDSALHSHAPVLQRLESSTSSHHHGFNNRHTIAAHQLAAFLEHRPTLDEIAAANVVHDTMTWSFAVAGGPQPGERNCLGMCAVESGAVPRVFLFGGFGSAQGNDLWSLEVKDTLTWDRPVVAGVAPCARYSHTMCTVGSHVVVIGGRASVSPASSHSVYLNDVHVLDTEFRQSFVPKLGVGLVLGNDSDSEGDTNEEPNEDAVLKESRKALLPTKDDDEDEEEEVDARDVQTMLFWYQPRIKGVPPRPRAAHSATVMSGNRILVFGGNDESCIYNDIHIFSTERMEWLGPEHTATRGTPPSPRAGHTAVCVRGVHDDDELLVVFGGYNTNGGLGDLHVLHVKTMTWSQPHCRGTPPSPRAGHVAIAVPRHVSQGRRQMLVFGGGTSRKVGNDLHLLSLDTMMWSRPSDSGIVPQPRGGCAATLLGARMFLYGGCNSDDQVLRDLHTLDMSFLTVQTAPSTVTALSNKKKKKKLKAPSVRAASRPSLASQMLALGNTSDAGSHAGTLAEQHGSFQQLVDATRHRVHTIVQNTRRQLRHKRREMRLKDAQYKAIIAAMDRDREAQLKMLQRQVDAMEQAISHSLLELEHAIELSRTTAMSHTSVSDLPRDPEDSIGIVRSMVKSMERQGDTDTPAAAAFVERASSVDTRRSRRRRHAAHHYPGSTPSSDASSGHGRSSNRADTRSEPGRH